MFGTGHRPDHLGGYEIYFDVVLPRLVDCARAALRYYKPDEFISGMAQGWDTGCAVAALELGIPLTAALPCYGQDRKWPRKARNLYDNILIRSRIEFVTKDHYTPECMDRRNHWMVDNSDKGLALYKEGVNGGTKNCLDYASARGVFVRNLWPDWVRHSGLKYALERGL